MQCLPNYHENISSDKLLRVVVAGLLAISLSACVSYKHTPLVSESTGPTERFQPAPQFSWYGPVPKAQTMDLDELDENTQGLKRKASVFLTHRMRNQELDNYQVVGFEFPSSGASGQPDNTVKVRYYQASEPGKWPLLIILPVWGSYEYPAEKLAWRIRKRHQGKVNIALLLGEERLLNWAGMAAAENEAQLRYQSEISAERIRVAVVDIRRLVDWGEQQAEVDSGRIALAGFSIGAVVGSIVLTQEPRIAAAGLIMGGANPAQLLTECNRIAGRTRDEVTARLDISTERYGEIMSSVFDGFNLSNFSNQLQPERLLVVDAGKDECIGASSREALWEGLDKPERYTIDGSHEGALLSMTFLGADFTGKLVVDFFDDTIELGLPSSGSSVAADETAGDSGDSTL